MSYPEKKQLNSGRFLAPSLRIGNSLATRKVFCDGLYFTGPDREIHQKIRECLAVPQGFSVRQRSGRLRSAPGAASALVIQNLWSAVSWDVASTRLGSLPRSRSGRPSASWQRGSTAAGAYKPATTVPGGPTRRSGCWASRRTARLPSGRAAPSGPCGSSAWSWGCPIRNRGSGPRRR